MYLMRGCDSFQVVFCPSVGGRDLAKNLERLFDASRHLLQEIRFPMVVSNRLAIGVAAMTWGGADEPSSLHAYGSRLPAVLSP